MSSLARRKRIKELREAGAKAYRDGKHIQTCPHKFMDEVQWKHGWIQAAEEENTLTHVHVEGQDDGY